MKDFFKSIMEGLQKLWLKLYAISSGTLQIHRAISMSYLERQALTEIIVLMRHEPYFASALPKTSNEQCDHSFCRAENAQSFPFPAW